MVSRASTARRLVVVLAWTGMIAPSLGAEPAASRPALVYSTYLGGSSLDLGAAVAVDPAGNAYVTGTTQSADFPVTGGSQLRSVDAFVTKLSPRGSLVWSTFFGAASIDEGYGIALDKAAFAPGRWPSACPTTRGGGRRAATAAGFSIRLVQDGK
jgi:hypothetical protein